MALAAPLAATVGSTSSSTITGDLPPSSSEIRVMFSSAAWPMRLPTAVEPVNATLSMPGCAASAAPGRRPVAGDDVERAWREPGLERELGQPQRGERRVLGGLEHDAAAGGERRPDLPHRHQQRKVPRNDRAHHADRLAARVGEELVLAEPGQRRLHRRAFDLGGPAGAVAQEVHRRRHVHALRDDERLAVVDRLDLGELGRVGLEQIGQLQEPALAIDRACRAPLARLERGARRLHGEVHVGGAGRRHGGHHLAGGGVAHVEPPARQRRRATRRRSASGAERPERRTPRHRDRGVLGRAHAIPLRMAGIDAASAECTARAAGPLSIGRARNALGYALRGCVSHPHRWRNVMGLRRSTSCRRGAVRRHVDGRAGRRSARPLLRRRPTTSSACGSSISTKSRYFPGPAPTSETRTYTRDGDSVVGVIRRTFKDGRSDRIEYTANFDREYPVIGHRGLRPRGAEAHRRIHVGGRALARRTRLRHRAPRHSRTTDVR